MTTEGPYFDFYRARSAFVGSFAPPILAWSSMVYLSRAATGLVVVRLWHFSKSASAPSEQNFCRG